MIGHAYHNPVKKCAFTLRLAGSRAEDIAEVLSNGSNARKIPTCAADILPPCIAMSFLMKSAIRSLIVSTLTASGGRGEKQHLSRVYALVDTYDRKKEQGLYGQFHAYYKRNRPGGYSAICSSWISLSNTATDGKRLVWCM